MNLDELAKEIRNTSSDPAVQRIADYLAAWKDTPDTAQDLSEAIERVIGNSWISSDKTHARVYSLWSAFRKKCIETISGMTMNERLYWFGLLGQFDAAQGAGETARIYAKLHAREA
jgi:hypothetical protein